MQGIKVNLDSRLIKSGEYFVPVKGETFDGHDFVDEVLAKGARGVIEVEELYRMANEKLAELKPIVIGVVGSVGKSTMRAYLTQILSHKMKVLEGDLNTKLGLATLIVNELADQKVVVAEMGIDRVGEMAETVAFLQPDWVIMTKLEKEHLQFLGSFETVVKENLVAIEESKTRLGYVNKADVEMVQKYLKSGEIIIYPEEGPARMVLAGLGQQELAEHEKTYLLGVWQMVRDRFGYQESDFLSALGSVKRPKGRLNIFPGENECVVIDDSYNAVADNSVIRGVEFAVTQAKDKNKELIVVLSTMRETGESEIEQHQKVAEFLNTVDGKLILVGDKSSLYSKFLKRDYFEVSSSSEFDIVPKENELYYVKGSQYYRMEKIVYKLMKEKERAKELLVRQDARWG